MGIFSRTSGFSSGNATKPTALWEVIGNTTFGGFGGGVFYPRYEKSLCFVDVQRPSPGFPTKRTSLPSADPAPAKHSQIDLWNINDYRYSIHHPCTYIIYPHCHFTSHLYYLYTVILPIHKQIIFVSLCIRYLHPSIHSPVCASKHIYIYNIPYQRSCMGKKRSYCLVSVDIPSLRTMDNQMATLPTSWSATAHFHLFALLSCSRNHWKMGGVYDTTSKFNA